MSMMSVRAGLIAFVTAFATMANAPTALAELPEHTLVAEFFDEDIIEDPWGATSWISASLKRSPSATMSRSSVFRARATTAMSLFSI